MVLVYSTTKGMAAMTVALAHSRGWLDYEEKVATYWPEFAQAGKERTTVRQLLAHQAGLFGFDEKVDRAVIADPDRLAAIMARQRPAWEPGERQAYHAISLGFYEGEVIRRVDPQHRTLGRFFADEIAAPLGLEFYIRLPASVPDSRLAPLVQPGMMRTLASLPPRMLLDALNPRSVLFRSLVSNPGTQVPLERERIYARELEIPSGGGVGTARAIAKAYGVLATDGHDLGFRAATLEALRAPAVPPRRGFHDACLRGEVQFSLGFMKSTPIWPFGHPGAFGAPGGGRLARIRGPRDRHRVRIRDEPDGRVRRRPSRRRAPQGDAPGRGGRCVRVQRASRPRAGGQRPARMPSNSRVSAA